jgi:hypothetical protein
MTAEVAVMNKQAVALAADSAVTFGGGQGPKIFSSADKIFALSKFQPVAVMIYGGASVLGVPWETVVKTYRKQLGETKFDTLEEYASAFLRHLGSSPELFPEAEQRNYIANGAREYFERVREQGLEMIDEHISQNASASKSDIRTIVAGVARAHLQMWQEAERLVALQHDHEEQIRSNHGWVIEAAIDAVFEKLPMDATTRKRLIQLALELFSRRPPFPLQGTTGLVFAGFGNKDLFPSLVEFEIDGVACNQLVYWNRRTAKISMSNHASIVPFAQGEMVDSFMTGVDPRYRRDLDRRLEVMLEKFSRDAMKELGLKAPRGMKSKLTALRTAAISEFSLAGEALQQERYVHPVMQVVSNLPKDELAAMAESLVNLTSFKRRVSMEPETVGGPIDVAVISKGDGLIWIKRKHYFAADANPQFVSNYYREE